jgi:hypothetical protein
VGKKGLSSQWAPSSERSCNPRHVHQAVLGSESPATAALRSVETSQENFLASLNGVQVLKLLFGHIQMFEYVNLTPQLQHTGTFFPFDNGTSIAYRE